MVFYGIHGMDDGTPQRESGGRKRVKDEVYPEIAGSSRDVFLALLGEGSAVEVVPRLSE